MRRMDGRWVLQQRRGLFTRTATLHLFLFLFFLLYSLHAIFTLVSDTREQAAMAENSLSVPAGAKDTLCCEK